MSIYKTYKSFYTTDNASKAKRPLAFSWILYYEQLFKKIYPYTFKKFKEWNISTDASGIKFSWIRIFIKRDRKTFLNIENISTWDLTEILPGK